MTEAVKRMLHQFDAFTENNSQYIDVVNNKRICGYGVWPGISHNRGYHINPCRGGNCNSAYKITAEMLWKQNMWAAIKPAELVIRSE